MVAIQFILSGRRQSDISLFAPRLGSFHIFHTRILFSIFADTSTIEVFQLHDVIQLFAVNAVRIVYITVRIRHGQYLATQFQYFLGRILSYVTGTGNQTSFAFQVSTLSLQHFHQEVDVTVAGSFRTNQRTAELTALTGESTRKFMSQLLIHTEHETYFATTYTDITGRYVCFRTDMTPQLQHESLNETHDLSIRLAARREVRTAFTATHGQSCQ